MSGPLLVWSDPSHWSTTAKPCRYCGQPTNLRDDSRRPSHKTCAEQTQDTNNNRKDAS